jgi:hypothetical protein
MAYKMLIKTMLNSKILNSMYVKLPFYILASTVLLGTAPLSAYYFDLTEDGQGVNGNQGSVFRPIDTDLNSADFTISAHTDIDQTPPSDPDADFDLGVIFIDVENGTGIRNILNTGSKTISGNKNEGLLFTFDSHVYLKDIKLTLSEIDFGTGLNDQDDPYLFLNTSIGDITLDETYIDTPDTFFPEGFEKGRIDFAGFEGDFGLALDTLIYSFELRETNGHIFALAITITPEPETYLTFGVMLLVGAFLEKRKKTRGTSKT